MSITSIIEQQIPSFIRDDDVQFSTFLDSYYRFLAESYDVSVNDLKNVSIELVQNETVRSLNSERGEIYHQLLSMKKLRDIDTTTVGLVSNFVSEYMNGVNAPTLDSIRSNMKLMKNFYENKGNENSFRFLFTLLYDQVINISYPFDKVLKLSENEWVKYDFIRVEETAGLSTLLAESVGNTISGNGASGILDSYTRHVIYGDVDKAYYKLILRDFVIGEFQPGTVTGVGTTSLTVMPGLGDVDLADVSGIYPSDKIKIENLPNAQQFGSSLVIDKMKSMTMDEATITTTENGYITFVNDYFTTYELDLDGIEYRIVGQRSGATGIVRDVDSQKRFWVENINGSFLTDYHVDKKGGSELVDIYSYAGVLIGNVRLGRLYSACDMSAVVKVENNGVTKTVINKGKNYKFNPYGYILDNNVYHVVAITGLGKIGEIKIKEMGYDYTQNSLYTIKVGSIDIGDGLWRTTGKEEYYKSMLNTLDGEAKLRDSNYYQEFSYEIFSETSMSVWKHPIKKLVHPAGMELFGREDYVSSPFDLSLTDPKQYYLAQLGIEQAEIENVTFEVFAAQQVEYDPVIWGAGGIGDGFTIPQLSLISNPNINLVSPALTSSVPLYDDSFSKLFFNAFISRLDVAEVDVSETVSTGGLLYTEEFTEDLSEIVSEPEAINIANYETIEFSDDPDFSLLSLPASNDSIYNFNTIEIDMSDGFGYEEISADSVKSGDGQLHKYEDSPDYDLSGTGSSSGSAGGRLVIFSDKYQPGQIGNGKGTGNIGFKTTEIKDAMDLGGEGLGDSDRFMNGSTYTESTIFTSSIPHDLTPPVTTYRGKVHSINYSISPSEMI